MGILTAYDKFIQVALKYGLSVFGLPKTGQTTVYTSYDDGYYQKGSSAYPRFIDNGDGTITDKATGLMWQKDHWEEQLFWYDAIWDARVLLVGGYTDWRLPNIKELMSIVDFGRHAPCIDTDFFPNTPSARFWSSTTVDGDEPYAWNLEFDNPYVGSASKEDTKCYIRPVRGGSW